MMLKSITPPAMLLSALVASLVLSEEGPQHDRIRFEHGLHVAEVEVECTDCHIGMESLPSGGKSVLTHDVCESCHEVEDDGECATCHTKPYPPIERPAIAQLCEGFAHTFHVGNGVKCMDCHGSIDKAGMSPVVPRMEDCRECHLLSSSAMDCDECHVGIRPLPQDHRAATWLEDHGLEAAFGTSECSYCHVERSCDECHQGVLVDEGVWLNEGVFLEGSPHPASWIFDHFVDATFGRDCLACHETRQFCTNCHRSMVPVPHEFGPTYANSGDGGEHKEEAEAFIEVCISCHDVGSDDPTCARCHD